MHEVLSVDDRSRVYRAPQWPQMMPDDADDNRSVDLYTAGQHAPAGRYRRADVPLGEVVEISEGDRLPASLDGHVAAYERMPDWRPLTIRPS